MKTNLHRFRKSAPDKRAVKFRHVTRRHIKRIRTLRTPSASHEWKIVLHVYDVKFLALTQIKIQSSSLCWPICFKPWSPPVGGKVSQQPADGIDFSPGTTLYSTITMLTALAQVKYSWVQRKQQSFRQMNIGPWKFAALIRFVILSLILLLISIALPIWGILDQ